MRTHIVLLTLLTSLISHPLRAQKVKLTEYASDLGYPIDIRNCNDDRLFVGDRNGLIRIVNPDGSVRSAPFLDIRGKVSSTQSEEGFLGFCFSPNYKSNGKFYVSYTTKISGDLYSIVEQYQVSNSDANIADESSALTIITVQQPFRNHKGGNIMFATDGYLYITLGDGGDAGDPLNNAQNKDRLLGKILRIDVANSSVGEPYVIPNDNPFVNEGGNVRKEIWAYGLRNPWRVCFDRIEHDLWIADVGEGKREEINFQPHQSGGGENYGWKIMEGKNCFSPSSGCITSGLIQPIYDYGHDDGRSIIGGNVFRSAQSRDLWGMYIFSDYRSRWIDGLRENNGMLSGQVVRLLDKANGFPISFGEDRYGEIYVCLNKEDKIYKVEDANPNPFPKAFILPEQTGNSYLLKALEGRNFTYQWLFNNNPLNGATATSYTATQNGEYKLVVTNQSGLKDTSAPFQLAAALPVTLVDFSAKKIAAGINEISWKTESEQNNKGFFVERKLQHEPGFVATKFISSKAANGNSSSEILYGTNDTISTTESIQYRLKQMDTDGRFAYSPIVTINASKGTLNVSVLPNPTKGWLRITTNKFDQFEYQLNDFAGKQVLKNSFNGNTHQFSVHSLSSGIYYLKVQANKNGEVQIVRVYIENN